MPEIILSWVHCKNCKETFPVEAKDERDKTIYNLAKVPLFCPFCGSVDLSYENLNTEYYG